MKVSYMRHVLDRKGTWREENGRRGDRLWESCLTILKYVKSIVGDLA